MTQVINAYNYVISSLDEDGRDKGIPLSLICIRLSEMLGIVNLRKAYIHVDRMVELGYLKKSRGCGFFPEQRRYDIISKKLQLLRGKDGW